jgi:hypothetical protein
MYREVLNPGCFFAIISANVLDTSTPPTFKDQLIYRKKETHNQGEAFEPESFPQNRDKQNRNFHV